MAWGVFLRKSALVIPLAWAMLVLMPLGCGRPTTHPELKSGFAMIIGGRPLLYFPKRPDVSMLQGEDASNRWISLRAFSDHEINSEDKIIPLIGISHSRSLLNLPATASTSACPGARSLVRFQDTLAAHERRLHIPPSRWDRISLETVTDSNSTLCKSQQTFDCLHMMFSALPQRKDFFGARSGAGHPWSQFASTFDACLRPLGRVETTSEDLFFSISGGRLIFSPAKLISILVYEGQWNSLAEALVSKSPVATLPLTTDCPRGPSANSKLACRRSPVPVSECEGCSSLKPGSLYSVFLISEDGLPDSVGRPVFYSPPFDGSFEDQM